MAAVIDSQLPALEVPDLGDSRAELWHAVEHGFPEDGAAYVGLIGGLIAEQERHPELIAAFRRSVLLPRRAIVQGLIERAQARGDLRPDIEPEAALALRVIEGTPVHADVTFEPTATGGTLVAFRAHGRLTGAMRLAEPFLGRMLRKQFTEQCGTLKQVLEQRPAAAA